LTGADEVDWRTVVLGDVVDFFGSRRIPLSTLSARNGVGRNPCYGASRSPTLSTSICSTGRHLLIAEGGREPGDPQAACRISRERAVLREQPCPWHGTTVNCSDRTGSSTVHPGARPA
jgi:hypothetical protein